MIRPIRYGVKKFTNAVALLSFELLIVFIIFFISLATVIVVIRKIFLHKEDNIDYRVFDALLPYVNDTNTAVMQFFTIFGSHYFLVPAFLLFFIYYFFVKRNKWYFIKMLTIALSNLLMMFTLKFFFNRQRPLIPLLKEVPGLSFPSGHAYMSFTFFGLLIYIVYRDIKKLWLKWLLIILLGMMILIVGLSRVYLRVHYASDVIAGYCFGALSLVILLWLLRQIEKYNEKKVPPSLNVTKTGETDNGNVAADSEKN